MNRYETHEYKKSLAKVQAALAELEKTRLPFSVSEPTWKTRDGRTIPVTQMTNEHLMNTLNMCLSRGWFKARVGFLKVEARRRGLLQ